MYEAIEKILLKALQVAETTGEFVMEQAPELLQEFYMWHMAISIFWILFAIGTSFLIIFILKTIFKVDITKTSYYNKYYWSNIDDEYSIAAHTFTGIYLFMMLTLFLINTMNLIQIWIAPKLYLIDYFLVNKGC